LDHDDIIYIPFLFAVRCAREQSASGSWRLPLPLSYFLSLSLLVGQAGQKERKRLASIDIGEREKGKRK